MILRPLWTVPISGTLFNKLKDAGYEYLEDVLCDANKEEVKKLIGDSKVDFEKFTSMPVSKTALELYKDELQQNENIVTFSKAIDDLIGGGIPIGKITEIVGAPGTGKTQICLQLCISVQIPEFLGGVFSSAVYIETNLNFTLKRIKEIHASCVCHCLKISSNESNITVDDKQMLKTLSENDPCNNIIKFSVETVEELRASIFSVQNLLEESNTRIRLLIIDSFTFPFYLVDINLERTKIISEILNHLNKLVSVHHFAVIVVNELTTCILDDGSKEIVPSLGESFAHAVHNRILLGRKESTNYYTALLCKSNEFPSESAYFQITDGGIRDVPVNKL